MFSSFQPFTAIPEPFAIGLKPVDPNSWIYRDSNFTEYKKQKLALYALHFDQVFLATQDSVDAQIEAEELIQTSLSKQETAVDRSQETSNLPPLARVALNTQDDLVLMRKKPDGWNLIAGSVCFPAHWTLSEKFNRPLAAIHDPVPMSETMHQRINRIFDSLQPSIPVWRDNWSLDDDNDLHKVKSEHDTKHDTSLELESFYLRTEYQTLHKLPVSGDVLFTIGTYTEHLHDVAQLPKGREMLSRFKDQVIELSDDEASYKGLKHCRQSLIDWLSSKIES